MKKFGKYFLTLILTFALALAFAACLGDNTSGGESNIKVTVAKTGATEGILEFSVQKSNDSGGEFLEVGENNLTYAQSESKILQIVFKIKPYYSATLMVGGERVLVSWSEDEDGVPVATKFENAVDGFEIELQVYAFHKTTVKITDNTDGLADFAVKFKGEIMDDTFEMYEGESFHYKYLSTPANGPHRFITTRSKHSGSWSSNSEGAHSDSEWFPFSASKEDELITIDVRVEYFVDIDITDIPSALRPNIKVISINPKDIPNGITNPEDIIGYGTTAIENKSISTLWSYIPKGNIFAIIYEDELGNIMFLPCEIDDLPSNLGLHNVAYEMKVKVLSPI